MRMIEGIRNDLIVVAQARRMISYGELGRRYGFFIEPNQFENQELYRVLGEISTDEHQNNRPLLSVVAVRADTNVPGTGFFTLAQNLGFVVRLNDEDKLHFTAEEMKRAHDFWSARVG
ncbi:MAG: hypothetical protein ACYCPQ_06475 [Elusimicrobiota bacterium]